MRTVAVQFRPDRADLHGSRARLAAITAQAAETADLVVLPELAVSGYVFTDREEAMTVAEDRFGPTFQALSEVARQHRSWIVCGFVEHAHHQLYNSALVIDHEGRLAGCYRKTLLFELDELWASVGEGDYGLFQTPWGSFTVAVCMDLNDDRFVRWLERFQPDVLAFPTNWLEQGIDVWRYWAWRMSRCSTTLVAANTWGLDRGVQFCGRSAVLRRGVVLAAAPPEGDGLVQAELHHAHGVKPSSMVRIDLP